MSAQWKRQRRRVSHADDWLMTYADTITLLLCFFIVFASASFFQKNSPPKSAIKQDVIPAIVEPEPFEINLPFSIPDEPDRTDLPKDQVAQEPIAQAPVVEPPVEQVPVAAQEQLVEKTPLAVSSPETIPNPESKQAADFELKGDRITSLEMNSAAFFDSGSATLSSAGKAILHDVAGNLKADKFKDYQITVEGHTDDTPINTAAFPSNWELSTSRAVAVVRYFLEEGLPSQKLRAAGYADSFPKAPNREVTGKAVPENQALNRRVVIKLEKIDKTP